MLKESCSRYLSLAARVASFLLQNAPWAGQTGAAKSEMQVLCDLAGTILSEIKETEIGRKRILCTSGVLVVVAV